jgi:hypothetical protein
LASQSLDNGWQEPCRVNFTAPDSKLSGRWIGQELNLLHALPKVVEGGDAAVEQGTAVHRRLDSMRTAIEKTDADRMFQLPDRLRHYRLGDRKILRRLYHAARLHHGHQYMQVSQLEAAADPVRPLHGSAP